MYIYQITYVAIIIWTVDLIDLVYLQQAVLKSMLITQLCLVYVCIYRLLYKACMYT